MDKKDDNRFYLYVILFFAIIILSLIWIFSSFNVPARNDIIYNKPINYALEKVGIKDEECFRWSREANTITYKFFVPGCLSRGIDIARFINEYLTLNPDSPLKDFFITVRFWYGSHDFGMAYDITNYFNEKYHTKELNWIFFNDENSFKYIDWLIDRNDMELSGIKEVVIADTVDVRKVNFEKTTFLKDIDLVFEKEPTAESLVGSFVYIKENGKYVKYYVFSDYRVEYVELIRMEALEDKMFWSTRPGFNRYQDCDIDNHLVKNIYGSFDENTKKAIFPLRLQNEKYNANIYILSKERVERISDSLGHDSDKDVDEDVEVYEDVLKYIQPGSWLRNEDSNDHLYLYRGIENDEPTFTEVNLSYVSSVQPVIAVYKNAGVELAYNNETDEFIWVFKGTK